MASSLDNVVLLLLGQIDELNCITRYTDCEVSILWLLRMCLAIQKLLNTKYVYVQVMSTICKVAIHSLYKVVYALFISVSKCTRVDGLSIGNTIQSPLVWQLSNRVQRCKQTVLLSAVRRVSTWRQWLTSWTTIRKSTSSLTINYVRSNGQDRGCRLRVTIGVTLLDLGQELS